MAQLTSPAPSANSIEADLFDELNADLTGTVELPGTAGYIASEPWNTAASFDPAAVVKVVNAADVSKAIQFATLHGLRVAVQATGHGATRRGRDTLLLNTTRLAQLDIDPAGRSARFGSGVVAGSVISAAADHGLAAILGSSGTVGVAGYLSGGGVGPLVSTFGLSADYVTSLEVVTGDGTIRRVSPTEHPDLFWAFRGGRSSVGVTVEVTLGLEPLTEFYGGALWFDGASATQVLHAWANWSASVPDGITTSIMLGRMPAEGPPPPIAGRFVVAVRIGSVLPDIETELLVKPIRDAAPVVFGALAVLPYRDVGRIHNEPTEPEPLVQDHTLLAELPPAATDAILHAFEEAVNSPLALVEVRRFGGALAREPEHASAFSFRHAPYGLTAIGFAAPGQQATVAAAAAELLAAASDWATGQILANFVSTRDPERTSIAYDRTANERLAQLAGTYDPQKLFGS